jgi:homoserine kinase type II
MKHIICLECPNGCNLTIHNFETSEIRIEGNLCEKGINFAYKIIEYESEDNKTFKKDSNLPTKRIVSTEKLPIYSKDTLSRIAVLWDIELKELRRDKNIEGSPERTVFRLVIEDKKNKLYVVEQIPLHTLNLKTKIIKTLEFLSENKMPFIEPYIKDGKNRYILEYNRQFWQVVPFIEGASLDREKYLYEKWRTKSLAQFLFELKSKSLNIPYFKKEEVFSLISYIASLTTQIRKHRPKLTKEIDGVIAFIENKFFHVYYKFPVSFCHGDYHPLNIIWGKEGIKRVIDWEFLGYKPEVYDVANIIGCLGIEHPSSLVDELVCDFISIVHSAKIISDLSFEYIIEFIVALRFAWLSEWLRKEDDEMIALELSYMKLLIDNKVKLLKTWKLTNNQFAINSV